MSNRRSLHSVETIERRVALVTVFLPLVALIVAIILLWGEVVAVLDLVLCGVMYVITGLGVTLGFHRLFTHRSFKCVSLVSASLGVAGSMAAQGPILFWTACHRRHHQFSDQISDPHSPHGFGGGAAGLLRGFWHAHTAWMFSHKPENYRRLVSDLLRSRQVVVINRFYFLWIAVGLLLPAVVGGLVSATWWGFLTGLLWGGFVRMFLVHHCTWSINSICHLFGGSPYETSDQSKNNFVCALLTFGEGWHNNHHAFPSSARHGLSWWQIDMVYGIVRLLRFARLAWDVRLPDRQQISGRKSPGRGAQVVELSGTHTSPKGTPIRTA